MLWFSPKVTQINKTAFAFHLLWVVMGESRSLLQRTELVKLEGSLVIMSEKVLVV